MKNLKFLVFSLFIFSIFGCTVRTYSITRERVDQELYGNQGYIKGKPCTTVSPKRNNRTIQQVEIELRSPIKFENLGQRKNISAKTSDKDLWGNQGYLERKTEKAENVNALPSKNIRLEKYTVRENDTLQKISQKFYGTSKNWHKIYEANRNLLSSPNKIYPGQTLDIPIEEVNQPAQNLK